MPVQSLPDVDLTRVLIAAVVFGALIALLFVTARPRRAPASTPAPAPADGTAVVTAAPAQVPESWCCSAAVAPESCPSPTCPVWELEFDDLLDILRNPIDLYEGEADVRRQVLAAARDGLVTEVQDETRRDGLLDELALFHEDIARATGAPEELIEGAQRAALEWVLGGIGGPQDATAGADLPPTYFPGVESLRAVAVPVTSAESAPAPKRRAPRKAATKPVAKQATKQPAPRPTRTSRKDAAPAPRKPRARSA